ncbi:MAG TPA: hypothetical protein VIW73_03125, partial [Candidatus Cybelea sp.]
MRAVTAAVCWVLLAATPPKDVPVDVAALAQPTNAARLMPPLARALLATGIPDPQTRVELELVAGDAGAADAVIRRLNVFEAVDLENVLNNKDPFGSWSDALERFKGSTSLSVNDAIRLVAAYAPETAGAPQLIERDQRRRFAVQHVGIRTSDGVTLAAVVVRS